MFDRKGFPPALKVDVLFFVSPDAGTFVFLKLFFVVGSLSLIFQNTFNLKFFFQQGYHEMSILNYGSQGIYL